MVVAVVVMRKRSTMTVFLFGSGSFYLLCRKVSQQLCSHHMGFAEHTADAWGQ